MSSSSVGACGFSGRAGRHTKRDAAARARFTRSASKLQVILERWQRRRRLVARVLQVPRGRACAACACGTVLRSDVSRARVHVLARVPVRVLLLMLPLMLLVLQLQLLLHMLL